jgi:ABC-type lipoprotein export system ATPase subunit
MVIKVQPIPNAPVIDLENVWRTYSAGTYQEVHALRGVNLKIEKPCVIAVKGRSGSGKTTLLNCMGGLDKPTRGSIHVFGQELYKMSDQQLTLFRRMQVGFIFQSFGLNPSFSAYENVDIMLRIAGSSNRECRERVTLCLDLVGLTKWRHHRPDELSGGQQKRIAIARALANHPSLILADEPTGDIDTATTRDILALFRLIAEEEHITIILASHDPLVDGYVDQVLRLQDGIFVNG